MALIAAVGNPPREYNVRERIYSTDLSDRKLKKKTRLTRFQYNYLLDSIADDLRSDSNSSLAVEPDPKLLAVLRFLATGEYQWSVADAYNVAQGSMCAFIGQVVEAIITLAPQHIRMPTTPIEMQRTAETFAAFPDLLGCVDGTLIPIQAPREDEAVFVDRKGNHSINCQIVCDGHMKILDVVALWPGSTHDSFVFRDCGLRAQFENNVYGNYKLIGDRGYALERYFLTVYRAPVTNAQLIFNQVLCETRSVVERCIGLLKGRWRCLHRTGGELIYSAEKTCRIVYACCILHNICFLNNGNGEDALDSGDSDSSDSSEDSDSSDDSSDSDAFSDSDVSSDSEDSDPDDVQQGVPRVGRRNRIREAMAERDAFVARHGIFHEQ